MTIRTEIEVLGFELHGIKMAVDTREVDSIITNDQIVAEKYMTVSIDKALGLKVSSSYDKPVGLIGKGKENFADTPLTCVLIEEPDEITSVGVENISALPQLFNGSRADKVFWGVLVASHNGETGEMVFLVSLKSLIENHKRKTTVSLG